ncbi:MAG: FtsH protease activity modulator HflK, partial [Pseudomonadota bacterium]
VHNNSGGPWGGGGGGRNGGGRGPWGGNGSGGGDDGRREPPRRPGQGPGQVPDLDDIVKKGQEQLKVLMGGRGGGGGGGGRSFNIGRGGFVIGAFLLLGLWVFMSIYTVRPEEQSVELFFGEYYRTGESGLNFAPWPVVTREIVGVTRENTEQIGINNRGGRRSDQGLMLTGDENIVDIDFEVVWNIADPAKFLFTLEDPQETIRAVSESAMREVIARSELAPILNRDRGVISDEVEALIQSTLDSYDAGVNVVRLNFDRADPPNEVIEAFRDVQAAEQDRVTVQNQADAYANQTLANARGEARQMLEQAEGYRAQVVNEATGEAARFISVYNEYAQAEEVTRRRLYIETLERVLSSVDKIVIDEGVGGTGGAGSGVVPYLPLNELRRGGSN